jgi:hypothetical protein
MYNYHQFTPIHSSSMLKGRGRLNFRGGLGWIGTAGRLNFRGGGLARQWIGRRGLGGGRGIIQPTRGLVYTRIYSQKCQTKP